MPPRRPARSAFARELADRNPDPAGRRWLFVAPDQLTDALGPLSREDPGELGIVLVEAPAKAARRPYHQQKLALVLANLRQFALEQAARGVAVDHRVARGSYGDELRAAASEHGTLRAMCPAERELRRDLAGVVGDGLVELVPHEGWLTSTEDFEASQKGPPPWRLDAFYRHVRRATGILMDPDGKPLGGKLSLDAENREPWRGEPPAAVPPTFAHDAVTEEVGALVAGRYGDHPGQVDLAALPATRAQAAELWAWAKHACLPSFGPYEDAMSTRSTTLFHTRVAALVHLHRLLPRQVVDDVLELDVELRCKEGFVRQVLGWREFVRHVHERTDGLRELPGQAAPADPDAPAAPSFLGADRALPPAWWGQPAGLACLDDVVATVWAEAYSHHITRLMVLSNLATLLDVSPRALTDWFWVAYTDAYDWVVEPNVLAMGTFATGPLMTTKPYVSGAAYLHRMGDACGGCAFDPKKTCPITPLYWAFLARHRDALDGNPRLRMPLASLRKRADELCERDARVFDQVHEVLAAGERLTPDGLAAAVDR